MAEPEKLKTADPSISTYTAEQLDYPDPKHDPFPLRRYSDEDRRRAEEQMDKDQELIAEYRRRQAGHGTKLGPRPLKERLEQEQQEQGPGSKSGQLVPPGGSIRITLPRRR